MGHRELLRSHPLPGRVTLQTERYVSYQRLIRLSHRVPLSV